MQIRTYNNKQFRYPAINNEIAELGLSAFAGSVGYDFVDQEICNTLEVRCWDTATEDDWAQIEQVIAAHDSTVVPPPELSPDEQFAADLQAIKDAVTSASTLEAVKAQLNNLTDAIKRWHDSRW
jgi:hypothetical protein